MRTHIDRVAVISDEFGTAGGAAAIALASVRQLRARGVPVAAFAGRSSADGSEEAIPLGGRHLLEGGKLRAAARGLYDPGVRARLSEWIAAHDTAGTLYHLHNWHKVLSPSCFAALRPVADRLIVSAHDFFLSCPNGGYFDFPSRRVCELEPLSTRCLVANCDKRNLGHKVWRVARHRVRHELFDFKRSRTTVLAVHEGMAPLLARGGIPVEAIVTLRNPVTPWRSRRIEAERNSALLYVGRLELDKGIDTLALAARRVGARLIVVGDGPLRRELADLCPGVEVLGHRAPSEIAAIAEKARAVVLPTRVRETFGLVALEAATSGLPVVSSTSALVTAELVESGAALACAPDDVDALAEVLTSLLRNDAVVEAMSRRAFAATRSLAPTEDEWGELLLRFYDRVLARAKADPRPTARRDGSGLAPAAIQRN